MYPEAKTFMFLAGEDEDISVVLTRAIQTVTAMKQLYVVSNKLHTLFSVGTPRW